MRRAETAARPHIGKPWVVRSDHAALSSSPPACGGGDFLAYRPIGLLARLSGGGDILTPRCPWRFSCFARYQRIGESPPTSPGLEYTHPIFGAFWAFLVLGERPPAVVWVGILVVVAGVYIMSSGGGPLARGRVLLLPISAAAFMGLAHTFRKMGLGGVESLVFGGFLQSVSACALGPLILKASTGWSPFVFNKASLGNFILAGLAMAAAQLCLMAALSLGEVSRVTPLVATVPLFMLVLAPLILGKREKITPRIVLGVLVTVAGVMSVVTFAALASQLSRNSPSLQKARAMAEFPCGRISAAPLPRKINLSFFIGKTP